MLNKKLCSRLNIIWGPSVTMDMFATHLNTQLPRSCSWLPGAGSNRSRRVSAGSHEGAGVRQPPFNLISNFLSLIKRVTVSDMRCAAPRIAVTTLVAAPQRDDHRRPNSDSVRPCNDLFLPGHFENEVPMGRPRWPAIAVRVTGVHSSTKALPTAMAQP